MTKINKPVITRRQFAASAAAFGVAAPGILRAQEDPAQGTVVIRTNNFSGRRWQEYFSSLRKGAILVDIQGRTLHYWPDRKSVV